eukprot:3865131-Prymnesium_polylepis.2
MITSKPRTRRCSVSWRHSRTAAQSTAAQSTAAQSTAAQSTAADLSPRRADRCIRRAAQGRACRGRHCEGARGSQPGSHQSGRRPTHFAHSLPHDRSRLPPQRRL